MHNHVPNAPNGQVPAFAGGVDFLSSGELLREFGPFKSSVDDFEKVFSYIHRTTTPVAISYWVPRPVPVKPCFSGRRSSW